MFHQDYRGELKLGVLRWKGPATKTHTGVTKGGTQYSHRGTFTYTSFLKPSVLFSESSATLKQLPEDWAIFANIVDTMDMSFNYQLASPQRVSDTSYAYSIGLLLENPGLWTKELLLVPQTEVKGGNIDQAFKLDLAAISDLTQKVGQELGRSGAEGINVTVAANVAATADVDGIPVSEKFSQSAKGILKGDLFTWNKDTNLLQTTPGKVSRIEAVSNNATYLGLGVGAWRAVFSVLLALGLGAAGYLYWLCRRGEFVEASPVIAEDGRVRRKYADMIAAVRDIPATNAGETVVPVATLEDLVKVAIDGTRPVLHLEANGDSRYFVIDGTTRYVYEAASRIGESQAAPGAQG